MLLRHAAERPQRTAERPQRILWASLLPGRSKRSLGIAATARVHGLVVVTRNDQDFRDLGVAILDPFRSPPARHEPAT